MSLIRATRSREMSNINPAFVLLNLFSQAFEPFLRLLPMATTSLSARENERANHEDRLQKVSSRSTCPPRPLGRKTNSEDY